MSHKTIGHFLLLAVLSLMHLAQSAAAHVLLKPGGENAMPLRLKFVKADVNVERQFAATEMTLVFQNETYRRTEADFIYTLPPHTIVTSFAYWFGNEKVVARVVEKELATSIYEFIRARQRDPALVEMINENTFRARIFPVQPNADLRVEMRLLQVLPSDEQGSYFDLPLGEEDKNPTLLDAFHVKVRVQPDADLVRVTNNYDLPITQTAEGQVLALSKLNYQPPRNLRVNLIRKPQALQAELYAAHVTSPAEPDGFFALALTPQQALDNPQVQISGVETYQRLPEKLSDVKANQALVLFGRYKGSGPATVTLTGTASGKSWSESRRVQFGAERESENIAAKGWAVLRMAQLSNNDENRQMVIDLSMRFGLPGKYTSWLAVPREEMKRYEEEQERARKEKLSTNFYMLGAQLVQEILGGHPNGATAQKLKKQLNEISRLAGWKAEERIHSLVESKMYEVAGQLAELHFSEPSNKTRRASLHRQLGSLARVRGVRPDKFIINALSERASGDVYQAARALADEIRNNRANSLTAQKLRQRIKTLGGRDAGNVRWQMWSLLIDKINELSDQYAAEKYSAKPDTSRLQSLHRQIEFMTRDTSVSAPVAIKGGQARWAYQGFSRLAPELIKARHSNPPDTKLIATLEREINRIARVTGVSAESALQSAEYWWAHHRRHELAHLIIHEKHSETPDNERIAAMRRELETLSNGKPATWLDLAAGGYMYSRPAPPEKVAMERVRDEVVAELKKEHPDAAKIKELSERFSQLWKQAGYESPWDWRGGNTLESTLETYRAGIEKLRSEVEEANAKGDVTKLTLLDNERRSLISYASNLLEARWGDPLLSVEAPADAEQVIALMPSGEVKKLVFNADSRKWEARFDIPTYFGEGDYAITIIIVLKNGLRRQFVLHYKVDLTPPTGNGQVRTLSDAVESNATLRLEFDAAPDMDRVEAVLPWGQRVDLKSPATAANRFVALVPIPATHRGKAAAVTFVLTDKAHNRTSVTVDMTK